MSGTMFRPTGRSEETDANVGCAGQMTTTSAYLGEAADRLVRAATTHTPCAPVRDLIDRGDVDSAYAVARLNTDRACDAGRVVIGRKVGLTSPAVQMQLGVDQPDFGVLYADMDLSAEQPIWPGLLLQPRIEAEIAFRLCADIVTAITADEAAGYVDGVYAAFEIVDSRIAGWDISLADTIADNASSGYFVLGDRVENRAVPDLTAAGMVLRVDGETVSMGVGADCLGSPWNALAWLADTAIRLGQPLRAGEIVLSGALGPMVPVTAGKTYEATISGIGSVVASFAGPADAKVG